MAVWFLIQATKLDAQAHPMASASPALIMTVHYDLINLQQPFSNDLPLRSQSR